jgi:hypothetical protein
MMTIAPERNLSGERKFSEADFVRNTSENPDNVLGRPRFAV